MLPMDQRPELEAFRKQSEGMVFNLGNLADFGAGSAPPRPRNGMQRSRTAPVKDGEIAKSALASVLPAGRNRNSSLDSNRLGISQSPKRMLSPGSLHAQEQARRPTPATGEPHTEASEQHFSGYAVPKPPSNATPTESESDGDLLLPAQQLSVLLKSEADSILLLDLRVSTQYTLSHISHALNLCIPTTLLKRPSFNIQKLADTFKDDKRRATFERWQRMKYIIVYDNSSAQLKDAAICLNTIKKFQNEGYTGTLHIIKGGFLEFSRRYPAHVELNNSSPTSSPERQLSDSDGPEVAPVAGGCPMPIDDAANPFFGNIRQNMDLIGGVGQLPIQHPERETKDMQYPDWLRRASEDADQGQEVSKRFEQIERREKQRMEDALSRKVAWGAPETDGIRIAGLEKGSKNRYNNIYPFEHSRVKLNGVPQMGCDYVNASYIQAELSNKRYISTQAPIPATFVDFWNVVWQQDVRVLVMLTAEKEGGQVKAHNYWDQKRYGPIHLEFLSEKRASLDVEKIMGRRRNKSLVEAEDRSTPYVMVRKFTLSHEGHPFERMREITQLHYSSWPDFGTPAQPTELIGLVRQCDAVVRSIDRMKANEPMSPNHRPVLVHCSAGCGRSGTFCTVDSVIDMLKRQRLSGTATSKRRMSGTPMDIDEDEWVGRNDLDLIEKTVEDFRHQRISMVQSLRQYVLCYESIMEWIVEQELENSMET